MLHRGFMKKVMAIVLVGSVAACYTVRNEDMFPIQRSSLSESQLAAVSIGGVHVERLVLQQDVSVDAYIARVPDARGTVVFFGGNGNEVTGVLPNLLPHLQPMHLDLIVMNYWATDQRQSNADSIRISANRLISEAIEISSGPVCVMGHSVGAWFALDAASRRDVSGVVLAAVGTTPSDLTIAQAGIWRPFLWHSAQDESLGLLDGIQLAGKAVTPVLVVTSTEDRDIPARLSAEVYNALPPTLEKRLLTLHGVSHGGYFRSAELWDAASQVLCRTIQ
jgi:pimeloyl-ACP methyl ester carboxylesterase